MPADLRSLAFRASTQGVCAGPEVIGRRRPNRFRQNQAVFRLRGTPVLSRADAQGLYDLIGNVTDRQLSHLAFSVCKAGIEDNAAPS
jgi:hypothetical protein